MTTPAWSWQGDTLTLNVRLQPRASRDEIVTVQADGRLKIRITAPPLEGRANDHLLRFLAKACGVSRSAVTLVSGQGSRYKRISISQPKCLPQPLKPQ